MPARRRHRPGLIASPIVDAPAWSLAAPDPPAPPPRWVSGTGAAAGPATPLLESLARLADLRDRGLLTDAEFAAATAYLLQ